MKKKENKKGWEYNRYITKMQRLSPFVDLQPIDETVYGNPFDDLDLWCDPKVHMKKDDNGQFVSLSDALSLHKWYKKRIAELEDKIKELRKTRNAKAD
jgi:hypothetical protein